MLGFKPAMYTRSFLVKVRRKALREHVWWRTLDRVERAIIDLTIRVVNKVRSEALGVEIVKILKKMKEALKSRFVKLMENYGLERARRFSEQAQSWGCKNAGAWAYDFDFIRYLIIIEMNNPEGFS